MFLYIFNWKLRQTSIDKCSLPWDGHEELNEGEIPTENNPIASYVKYFTVPQGWNEVFVSSRV